MQVHDDITHRRIIHSPLRARAPGGLGGRVIREDANEIERLQILELEPAGIFHPPAENQMEQWRMRLCLDHGNPINSSAEAFS